MDDKIISGKPKNKFNVRIMFYIVTLVLGINFGALITIGFYYVRNDVRDILYRRNINENVHQYIRLNRASFNTTPIYPMIYARTDDDPQKNLYQGTTIKAKSGEYIVVSVHFYQKNREECFQFNALPPELEATFVFDDEKDTDSSIEYVDSCEFADENIYYTTYGEIGYLNVFRYKVRIKPGIETGTVIDYQPIKDCDSSFIIEIE